MTDSTTSPDATITPPGGLREFWFYFRENRGAVIGLCFFAIFVFCAAFAPFLSPYDPTEQFREFTLMPPRLGRRW